MKPRFLSMILAVLMLSACLAGCADNADEGDQGSTNADEQVNVYEQALGLIEIDMGGESFAVICRNDAGNSQNEVLREEQSTDPLETAVYTRNLELAEKCNIDYLVSPVATGDVVSVIENDIKGGSGEYAIAFPDMVGAGTLAQRGYLRDFYDMPYIDLDAEWWDQGTAEMKLGGKVFWMNSDINFLAHDVTFLTLFSKVLADKEGLGDLYATVNNHEWTLDVFSWAAD